MNNIISNLLQQLISGQLSKNALTQHFNTMMNGKSEKDKWQTLLNMARANGFNVDEKRFSEEDLRQLGLK